MKKYPLGIIGANGTVGKTLVEQYQSKGMNPILINRENFEKNSKNFFNLLIISCFDARKAVFTPINEKPEITKRQNKISLLRVLGCSVKIFSLFLLIIFSVRKSFVY